MPPEPTMQPTKTATTGQAGQWFAKLQGMGPVIGLVLLCVVGTLLNSNFATLDNISIYTFLVPFQGQAKPIGVWCAQDRERAWQRLMQHADASLLDTTGACSHPIQRNLALAQRLGIQGTPTLIWADGSRTDGFVERAVLEARAQDSIKAVKP